MDPALLLSEQPEENRNGQKSAGFYGKDDAGASLEPEKVGELLRLIEVGASCFTHYRTGGCDDTQAASYKMSAGVYSGYSIPI